MEDDAYRVEELSLESGGDEVVRIMNLHQAKGLEADVVFLADPIDTSFQQHGVDSHVSRIGQQPYLSLAITRQRPGLRPQLLAEPAGWEEDQREEERFLQAEELRLLYVAATRARNLLVVSTYDAGGPASGPWSALNPALADTPEIAVPPATEGEQRQTPTPDWAAQQQERNNRWIAFREPSATIDTESMNSEIADGAMVVEGTKTDKSTAGWGREYGTAVHRLFEVAVNGRLPADERAYIDALLAGVPEGKAAANAAAAALDELRASELWRELRAATERFTEVPLAVSDGEHPLHVHRGVVDLVYRHGDGWKMVDYKTDPVDGHPDVEQLAARYTRQVAAYARHWTAVTGEAVAEFGLWIPEVGFAALAEQGSRQESRPNEPERQTAHE